MTPVLRRSLSLVALIAGLCWSEPASAIEPQYRRVTLVDGRVISAEILATEAKGLRMRVPAGETLISFELLLDMVPISQAEYDAQPPWVVYFSVPPQLERDLVELLQAIDGLIPQPVSVAANGVTTPMAAKAENCSDIGCMVGAVAQAPWMWVLFGSEASQGTISLQSKLNTSPSPPFEATVSSKERDEIWLAVHEALGLELPNSAAPKGPEVPKPQNTPVFDERKVVALSFIPVPGYPSLAQKDTSGFALAAGIFVPTAAVWVVGVRNVGGSTPEFAALSVVGLYTVTVFTNQVTGMRSLEKQRLSVGALPTEAGGAMVVLGR